MKTVLPTYVRPASTDPWSYGQSIPASMPATGRRARTLTVSGFNTADDRPLFPVDLPGQLRQAARNLRLLLNHGGFASDDVVRMTLYTTHPEALTVVYSTWAKWLNKLGISPVCALVPVSRLSHPEMLVEVEVSLM